MANVIIGDSPLCGIKKKILIGSRGEYKELPDGTRVTFLYQTRLCNDDHTVLDDNRKHDKPMELIFGKKFKLEVWETCLKSMKINEVASFTVDPSLVSSYPMVAKSLRDIHKGQHGGGHQSHHCCGMTLKEHGLGYPDLDDLMLHPQPLEFILELLSIEEPGGYEKEAWAMDVDEKLDSLPRLREEGNKYFADKDYVKAGDKYSLAIGMLEQLTLREKPGDEEFIKLDHMKIPFLLNLAQCKLFLQDYYPAIDHTTEVLNKDPGNVKALFRRAKAHVGAWNPSEARLDFQHASELDPSLEKAVVRELHALSDMEKEKEVADRKLLQGKMFD